MVPSVVRLCIAKQFVCIERMNLLRGGKLELIVAAKVGVQRGGAPLLGAANQKTYTRAVGVLTHPG